VRPREGKISVWTEERAKEQGLRGQTEPGHKDWAGLEHADLVRSWIEV
jgi:hypothetical protein